jgi:hypothetical protein
MYIHCDIYVHSLLDNFKCVTVSELCLKIAGFDNFSQTAKHILLPTLATAVGFCNAICKLRLRMKKNETNLQIGKFTHYKMETEVIYYFIESDLCIYTNIYIYIYFNFARPKFH